MRRRLGSVGPLPYPYADNVWQPAMTRSATDTRPYHLIAVVAICLLGAGIYSNTLGVPFVFDDVDNIQHNHRLHITSLDLQSLREAAISFLPRRAVANVSFALNYYFGRLDVAGYHLVNIAIHLVNGILVYLLALRLLKQARGLTNQTGRPLDDRAAALASLAAALVFTAHPLQTQAVTYIVQRMTSLAAMFYLLSLLLYVQGRLAASPRRRWVLWGLGLVSWLLGLGTKENTATLPVAVLLVEWFFFQDLSFAWLRKSLWYLIPLVVVLAVLAVAFLGHKPLDKILAGYERRDFTPTERVLTQFRVVILYFSLVLYPHPGRLNLIHHIPTSHSLLDPWTTLACLLLILAFVAVAIFLARRRRVVSFCLLWVVLHLAIESSIIGLEMVFEHRMYLPMFGVSIIVGLVLGRLFSRSRARALCLTCLLVLPLGAGTYLRNRIWQDREGLWTDVIAKNPWEHRAFYNRAGAYADQGRYGAARRDYAHAIELKSDYPWPYNNLARLLATCPEAEFRDGPRAVEYATTACRLLPLRNQARHRFLDTLAAAHAEAGNFDEAVKWQEKAVQMSPLRIRGDFQARLARYRRNRPYREPQQPFD